MKQIKCWLMFFAVAISVSAWGQPATSTTVLGIGRSNCTGGANLLQRFSYNAGTNTLSNASNCVPSLAAPGFSSSASVIDYNPKDQNLYYFRRVPRTGAPGVFDTHVWRWAPGSCPTGSQAPLTTFLGEYLTVAFDAAGNGWMVNLVAQGSPVSHYNLTLRKVDFTTNTVGVTESIALPAGINIYKSNGDYLITPGGNMFFAYDNKLLTINYNDYGVNPLAATYIDTIPLPAPNRNLIGLAYADGEFVGSFIRTSGGVSCGYGEIDLLTGDRTAVNYTGTVGSFDNTSVVSGIGVSKNLVSVTPVGPPNVYDVVYDVTVKNYGTFPVSGIQVTDDLRTVVTSAGNLLSASATLIDNPAGVAINTGYNGNSNRNLIAASQVLPNTPLSNNHFTIRITARFQNVVRGRVYNNSAEATGTGFGGVALRDVSTNGTNPDLNLNDKPDDAGENVVTPFVVTVASETPPCSDLATVLHSQDFGTGADQNTMPAGTSNGYTGSTTAPLTEERFVITSNPSTYNTSYWNAIAGRGGSGRMMVVNADVENDDIYTAVVTGLCANLKYSFSAWIANLSNNAQKSFCAAVGGFKNPRLNFRVRDAISGLVLTSISTADITGSGWTEYGMRFVLPSGSSALIIEIINEGEGGCGNDFAIDDIRFGLCDPTPTVNTTASSAGCMGSPATLTAILSDPTIISGPIEYQWQSGTDDITFTNIAGATASTYTIPSFSATDVRYYRVLIAAAGNINSAACRYTSASHHLTAKTASAAPTGITRSTNDICPADAVTLTVQGGSLGNGAVWRWYSASCGGTPVGTGSSITVNPTATTTYYVRAEGDCNTTTCASVTVTVNCDIDKDNDGITDAVEGTGDADSDGVPNYLDLDSDNDGIPDVVESGGVDASGDGRIDNYTDTDADGLSQNVDGNATGHLSSGTGLGALDTDGDGVPNFLDLDSDNDGVPDVTEVYGADSNNDGRIDGYTDTDGDGFSNNVDGDVGNDGVAENSANALLRTGADTNGDGRADSYPNKNMDADTKANLYDLDSDGDGITDVREAGLADSNNNGLTDAAPAATGWSTVAVTLPNTDATGRPNIYDIDSDNDGIPDNIEGLPTASYLLPLAADTDGDGIDNAYDAFNGFGGNGNTPFNMDGDPLPDYMDSDTDGDGSDDIREGNDFNFNTLSDDLVTLTGLDTDDDGLDNRFDTDNSSASGTSAYMGNSGSFSGPSTPGSRTVVQRSSAAFPNRDWRYLPFILNCRFIDLNATYTKGIALLKWTVYCDQQVAKFIIERKTAAGFQAIAEETVKDSSITFTYADGGAGIAAAQEISYRIIAIDADGKRSYSQMVSIGIGPGRKGISVLVNPVQTELKLIANMEQNTKAVLQIYDYNSRLAKELNYFLRQGQSMHGINVSGLPAGSYYLYIRYANGAAERLRFQVVR